MTDPLPSRREPGAISRRNVLAAGLTAVTGLGVAHSIVGSEGFHTAVTDRESIVTVTDDADGLVGLTVAETVRRKTVASLATVRNNAGVPLSVTVALETCSQGVLFGPGGGQGCSVSFTLPAGQSSEISVDADAAANTQLPFVVSGEAAGTGFSFSLSRETTAVAGPQTDAIRIRRIQLFRTRAETDEWTIRRLTVESDAADIARIDLVVREVATGVVVSTTAITGIGEAVYDARQQGNEPALVLSPDQPSNGVDGTITYELTVTAVDVDGNVASATATD